MLAFAVLAAAVLHDPSPDDVHRFGHVLRSTAESPLRNGWNASRERLTDLSRPVSAWIVYGRESEFAAELADARWRERVWDAADDLGRECASIECRLSAAHRLRGLVGPVAYWLGELPPPVP